MATRKCPAVHGVGFLEQLHKLSEPTRELKARSPGFSAFLERRETLLTSTTKQDGCILGCSWSPEFREPDWAGIAF